MKHCQRKEKTFNDAITKQAQAVSEARHAISSGEADVAKAASQIAALQAKLKVEEQTRDAILEEIKV